MQLKLNEVLATFGEFDRVGSKSNQWTNADKQMWKLSAKVKFH